jgi:zinc transport system ATP-binding protein
MSLAAGGVFVMEPLIEVAGVRFGYGERAVLDDVAFFVAQGEFVGIIGSNGAGKSTLLRLLLGELKPDTGVVRMLGQDVAGFNRWPKIGYVQQHGLSSRGGFPATAEEIVLSGLYTQIGPLRLVRRKHRDQARQALDMVGMGSAAHTLIGTLSGGQLQRVLLARVLVGQPEVLLLDEPLTGIDADSSDRVYRLLRLLSREKGIAVLMVTHDVTRAAQYLDRVLCLEYGTLVELERGQIEHEMRHRHRHPPAASAPDCGWPGVDGKEEEESGHGHL